MILSAKRCGSVLGIVIVSLAHLSAAWGQEGSEPGPSGNEVLTLERAIDLAGYNNRQMKNTVLDKERADDQLAAAKTQRLPQLSITTLESHLLTPLSFTFGAGSLGTFPATGPIPATETKFTSNPKLNNFIYATASQPLSQLYRITQGIDAHALSQEVASEQIRSQRQALVNNTKRNYYAVLQTQSALEAAQDSLKSVRELERVVTQLVQQQKALKSDLLDVTTQVANAEYNVLTLSNQLASQKEQLNVLLGRPIATEFSVAAVDVGAPVNVDLSTASAAALKQRPELKGARLKMEQAERDRKAKRAEYIPNISMVATYIRQDASSFFPESIGVVGLQLNWEPFDWGRKKHELAEKTRIVMQSENSVRETEAQTMAEVNSQYRKLQEAYRLVEVNRLARDTAREKLRITTNRYVQKAALLQDVLQAQATAASAANQHSQALLSFLSAKADFEKAIGAD